MEEWALQSWTVNERCHLWIVTEHAMKSSEVCSVCPGQICVALNSVSVISSVPARVCRSTGHQTHRICCSHLWRVMDEVWPSCLWSIFQWCTRWLFFTFLKKDSTFTLEVKRIAVTRSHRNLEPTFLLGLLGRTYFESY